MLDEAERNSQKSLTLNVDDVDRLRAVAHALSSTLRVQIIRLLDVRAMNINELAHALNVPISTVAASVQLLEQTGLVASEMTPGVRGMMKICVRRLDRVRFDLAPPHPPEAGTGMISLLVGQYSTAGEITPTCGIATPDGSLSFEDNPLGFFHPSHFQARLVWMRTGYVEYCFPTIYLRGRALTYVEFSFEACAEAAGYRNDWPSDIYVTANEKALGTWHCKGDYGGRRGLFCPKWWPDNCTQHGELKTWRITPNGTYLDGDYISDTTLRDLNVESLDHIRLRIGVKADVGCPGGLNLIGSGFGDYDQDILMRYAYNA